MQNLSQDVFFSICNYLSFSHALELRAICKYFFKLISSDALLKYYSHMPSHVKSRETKSWYQQFFKKQEQLYVWGFLNSEPSINISTLVSPFIVNMVVIGDAQVGKSTFMVSYGSGGFPENLPSLLPEVYRYNLLWSNMFVELCMHDTNADAEWLAHRVALYKKAHVVVIMYDVTWRDSYDSVRNKWFYELRSYNATVPCLVIGNKCDLKHDKFPSKQWIVPHEIMSSLSQENFRNAVFKGIEISTYLELPVTSTTVQESKKKTCTFM